MFSLSTTNNNWTLFLDRDGVINFEKENDYVLNWQEFRFYDTTLKALAILKDKPSVSIFSVSSIAVCRF